MSTIFMCLTTAYLITQNGKEYVFVSNVDSLGATIDEDILNHMGRVWSRVSDGEHVEDFKSIKTFKIVNTNNLWVNLKAIKRVVENHELSLEVIVSNKTTDSGEKVIQLETASTSGLFLVTSDLHSLTHGELSVNPKRMFNTVPLVKLGNNFKKVNRFLSRFKNPSHILELDPLTVSGDVSFGSDVVLKGTAVIVANAGSHIDIPRAVSSRTRSSLAAFIFSICKHLYLLSLV
ncbi:UTP-glucose-1-phosphate uridylyltransferase [Mortierella sp. AD032]|nr:UTP-glucose-1-phosphate uridylyltransferase [Mortierella sp. AD032]